MRNGIVRVEGYTLQDDKGPFLGLGATYMQALRHCKFDRERLNGELAFLAGCGFNYVRVLSMVDWPDQEIAPIDHRNKEGRLIKAWPDYDRQLEDLVDIVNSHGLRTQLTIFADAQVIMPDAEVRRRHLQRIMNLLRGRTDKVILYEVANEGWQNGFPGEEGIKEVRELGREASESSSVLVALTSPPDMGDRSEALMHLYGGSSATIATVHFSRDLRTDAGGWLPVIDCWKAGQCKGIPPISSNEPIGPGASVASEDDPDMILAAAAFCYLAGLPMYVFHSGAGVKAKQPFESLTWLPQFKALLGLLPDDLPNWKQFDGASEDNVLVAADDPARPLYNCGARKGKRFVYVPLALSDGGRVFNARADLSLSVYELPTCREVQRAVLKKGETFALTVRSKACIIKGVIDS